MNDLPVQKISYPIIEAWIDAGAKWLKERANAIATRHDLDACGEDAARMANELGVSKQELYALVAKGPQSADELPRMMRALGLNPAIIDQTLGEVMRDLQRHCAMCDHKGECRDDLAAGRAAAHYREYCANAATLDALKSGA